MTFRQFQPNFSRGELAPELYGRFDVDTWASAVKQARNVVILKYGGLTKRPGTELVGEVLDASAPNRLVPFQFSLTQTYALEMGQGYMTPCAFGGRVVEEELAILNVTNAPEAEVRAIYHGYAVGDAVYITGVGGEIGRFLNGRSWRVTSAQDDSFTINADTSGLEPFSNATGGTYRSSQPEPAPSPPPVPQPTPTPTPPPVYGGGGGEWGGGSGRFQGRQQED